MITIAVINQKGGTGKTTTSVNLAAGLARLGKRTLLIDMDPQAHATHVLRGSEPPPATMAEIFAKRGTPIESIAVPTTVEKLDIAPSGISLARAAESAYAAVFREAILKKAMEGLSYKYCILDCPPTLGLLAANSLLACDKIIVPCQMSMTSLDGLADLWETIHEVKGGDRESFLRILLTMLDSRTRSTNDAVLDQLDPYKNLMLKTKIARSEPLNQAYFQRTTIYDFQRRSRGAEDYLALTEEVRKLWPS